MMMNKKECKITQDLLPNYIENLTSSETNEYIEEHLQKCENCKKIHKNMLEKIKTNNSSEEIKKVNYIKKFSHKMRILKIALSIILIIIVAIIARKTIILSTLANKAEHSLELGNENFYYKLESITNGNLKIWETYYKDGTTLLKITTYSLEEGENKQVLYQNETEKFGLTQENGVNKSYTIDGIYITPITITSSTIFDNIFTALFSNIQKVNLNGKQCYIIRDGNTEKFIDANTGVALKMIDNQLNQTVDYTYKPDIVSDQGIQKPDTSSYILNN